MIYGPRMYFGAADDDAMRRDLEKDLTRWRTHQINEKTNAPCCYFCGEFFTPRRGTRPQDHDWDEEVGEFWSEVLQDSVLAHPDCLPMGIEATLSGDDPEWKMA